MMDDSARNGQPPSREGLCARCRHRRAIENDRGSRFIFCERSKTDATFAKYPRLPVVACRGFEAEARRPD